MRLTRTEIGFFEDYAEEEVLEIGFQGVDESGIRKSFSLQRSTYEPDQQEIQHGMDSYCVSTERGLTLYGCLDRVHVGDAMITLELNEEDAEILESEVLVEIEIGDWSGGRQELLEKLRNILDWGAEGKQPELIGFNDYY